MEHRPTRQYQAWYTGDGATTEYALPKDLLRPDDLIVTVQGLVQRPADATGAYDYDMRGFRPVFAGQKNRIKFTVAPPVGVHIHILINAS